MTLNAEMMNMRRELKLAAMTADALLDIGYESDLGAHVEVTQL